MKTKLLEYQNIDCRKFNGYKPCEPYKVCPCADPEPCGITILIVNLDFIGDVLMTTAMLPAIKRTYPVSTIHWITRKNAVPVLMNNPYIHKVWEWTSENRMILRHMEFDLVLNGDKNLDSAAFTMSVSTGCHRGFGINSRGAIIPLNKEALYNFRMGLDDELKFRKNTRTGLDILGETWKVDYRRDEYVLELTQEEQAFCREYMEANSITGRGVIGFNTGCSNTFPLKKLGIDQHAALIDRLHARYQDAVIALVGGKEDTERNREIAQKANAPVLQTPTDQGLRRGIVYENICHVVVSGDTLGMHIGIGLKKQVVAWFGISCSVEIDLFGRGEKIQSPLDCSPCWRKTCSHRRCITEMDLDLLYSKICSCYERTQTT